MTHSLCLTPVFTMFRKSLLRPVFKGLLVIAMLAGHSTVVTGQTEGNDELFDKARQLAFNKQRQEAREVCAVILEKNPDYFDARILLGRLHSWDGNYEIARKE